jgi:hypothetical protein
MLRDMSDKCLFFPNISYKKIQQSRKHKFDIKAYPNTAYARPTATECVITVAITPLFSEADNYLNMIPNIAINNLLKLRQNLQISPSGDFHSPISSKRSGDGNCFLICSRVYRYAS